MKSVSIHGMYDCHLFKRFEGRTVDEVIENWRAHCAEIHPAEFEDGSNVDDLGATALCPAIVSENGREVRRVGPMVHTRKRAPDETALKEWRAALLADADIPTLLMGPNSKRCIECGCVVPK